MRECGAAQGSAMNRAQPGLFDASEGWWCNLGQASLGAVISDCGRYRTMLWRTFDGGRSPMAFCMLNPSTADASVDDPTIRRCREFARRESAGGIIVVNMCPWRATDPRDLDRARGAHEDVMWDEHNQDAVETAWRLCSKFVVAWGAGIRPWMERAAFMVRRAAPERYCLGETKMGEPRHPLYLARGTPLELYP